MAINTLFVTIKEGFGFTKNKKYEVIAHCEDYFKVVNDDGECDWIGNYLIEELINIKIKEEL